MLCSINASHRDAGAFLLPGAHHHSPWRAACVCVCQGKDISSHKVGRRTGTRSLWSTWMGQREGCEQERAVTAKADRILMFPS